MTKASVYNQSGEKISELTLNPKIFGIEKLDANLIHAAVRTQRNNVRGPWAHTKMMGEVAGSGKKPWKQKGTGRARAGSVRSPLWRHGGITFGPRNNRDWSLKMNRSAWRKALFTVLTDKFKESKLIVVDKIGQTAKTGELAKQLNTIAAKAGLGKKFILIIATHNAELENAARNLPNVKILPATHLNVLDLMRADAIVTADALPIIEKTYLK
ncbi:MAG: 50S ribosomal protein L4 [Candidatus Doudnabacteria bacterium RIFCSPLOWO2_02_FULL_49_13]|uniref:Large ribosomal subunit protein uL4 n=1 Tax=Candidatus Doudnabacteria bacterium RIFCSPHIGHO2_12_FULL_48_16 TaxID=1817838 RepID=A0A1F5PK19_9BACT|nr:ribosomal protein L4 [uncultured bacterium]OGE87779.1 MAG: 50S ribosomal protein L4 [Candidatus Doudnabacteria bacterium RIFCSPHIGHO2_02_FULL_49_24]OGE88141.1 MAG: 50S ribosomal protein L4 [Candidatus Doudnabacteria bacterium RIFCSPHIGHO2_01_FULL_50_67]OGE90012.1 MAG: 50S ribosomal protein L4 [Candidatus Doudnabacteria bacterium RIFCSPHIGHO2_12_FULL_48_16]OGE96585.1 MAG: 50S ribosomal protein L4 [Candidatus Doudnabacteria bacterium RIFCSPLOWO2_01_FULL_49_40]OGF03155.1 MAG: 50S ribosomal pro